ncbi:nuclease-related domain-containing protein [Heyndrickxia sp. NPDC080065]|uniref:nuclease-related domain-containing protein n=1 Tax=Heyndrickxia sp. NPDC080065 TaxID=3390568 RepID=UPI003D05AB2C
MIIKRRFESLELKILRCLNMRMNLSAKEASYLLTLVKGFKGEQKFDEWLEDLSGDWLILNDLLIEMNNNVFQIDSVLISQKTTYLIDVKNYEGDFYIDADKWYTLSGTEIKNPLLQLKRSESLFRQLLQDLRFHSSIEAYLIFVNPDFYLYQAPRNLPIIFPSQINRFLNKINMRSFPLKDKHSKFAQQLIDYHLQESPYMKIPDYHYDQLEKGITCAFCHSFVSIFNRDILLCHKCGAKEEITAAVIRSVEEIKMLFPDKKITTNTVHKWCRIINSKKTIQRILSRNFNIMGHGKSSFYVDIQGKNN